MHISLPLIFDASISAKLTLHASVSFVEVLYALRCVHHVASLVTLRNVR